MGGVVHCQKSGIVGDGAVHEVKADTVKTSMATITNHNSKVWSG